jgi:hypothetical protein
VRCKIADALGQVLKTGPGGVDDGFHDTGRSGTTVRAERKLSRSHYGSVGSPSPDQRRACDGVDLTCFRALLTRITRSLLRTLA